MNELDPNRSMAIQELAESQREDSYDRHQQRLQDAQTYLEKKEVQGELLDQMQTMHNAEIVMVIGRMAIEFDKLFEPERLQQIKRAQIFGIKKRFSPNLIIDGDDEGYDELKKIYETLFDKRVAYFQACRDVLEKYSLDADKTDKELKVVRRKLEKMAKEYYDRQPPEIITAFAEADQDQLLEQTFGVELTKGCSIGCNFCGFSAERGIKDSMTFSDAAWIITHTKNVIPYFASDPLDYVAKDDTNKTFADLVNIFEAKNGYPPNSTSAYPKGKKYELFKLGDRLLQLSISHMNKTRLIKDGLFKQTEKGSMLPSNEIMLDIILNNNSQVLRLLESVKEAGPEEASRISYIAARSTRANVLAGNYGQRLGTINEQIEAHKTGRGRKENQQDLGSTILCRDGVLITTECIYNVVQCFSTETHPQGYIRTEISPDALSEGSEQILKIAKSVDQGEKVYLEELLNFSIVHKSESSSYSQRGTEYLKSKQKHFHEMGELNLQQQHEYGQLGTHKINVSVSVPGKKRHKVWECCYDEVDGRIVELKPAEKE